MRQFKNVVNVYCISRLLFLFVFKLKCFFLFIEVEKYRAEVFIFPPDILLLLREKHKEPSSLVV